MTDYNLLLALASITLCILVFARSILLARQTATQSQILMEQDQSLSEYRETIESHQIARKRELDFEETLQNAEITTELQQSRISLHRDRKVLRAPERYSFVNRMYQSGMKIHEISKSLGMSQGEISQLIKLSELANPSLSLQEKRV